MRLLARLLEEASDGEGAYDAEAWSSSLGGVRSLHSQLDALPATRRAELQHNAAMLCGLIAEVFPSRPAPSVDIATTLLAIAAVNAHTITDDELQPIGLGLFPLAALTNHDCAPSCVQTFDGASLVLRALRPLRKGDSITIAYTDVVGTSPAQRHAELASSYHFSCACDRCKREAPDEARLHAAAQRLTTLRTAALAAIDEQRWGAALDASTRCCELLSEDPANVEATSLPSIGIERVRRAKLLAHAGRTEEAAAEWQRALAVLRVTHGDGAVLVKEAEAAYLDVSATARSIQSRSASS